MIKIKNPWEEVSLEAYENHMKLPTVKQLQALNRIMKSQIEQYDVSTITILGIAGDNGLEHIDAGRVKTVYGIDINQNYLNACKKRYGNLEDCLVLVKSDLSNIANDLPQTDIVIANLFIEYIGMDMFSKQLSKLYPQYVSCVIQKNIDAAFISDSPYTKVFDSISELHQDIEKDALIDGMRTIGYSPVLSEEYLLPNIKKFIRLDFYNT